MRGVGPDTRYHGNPPADLVHHDLDDPYMLIVGKGSAFTGGPRGNEAGRALLQDIIDQAAKALLVDLAVLESCLLYTSDAADDLLCVDLGGRRIIKKKKN